ncbi:13292_t:CDS:2 [Ambispora leptoticha]|uniref:13292_t:CDS:1 n=1 Tax=Ambispora leptoticha TaxID=144679 RepID=A0A9N9AYZ1_9GLOM|nr:13292_t:CDS:2 [Ambispora leptoticha]
MDTISPTPEDRGFNIAVNRAVNRSPAPSYEHRPPPPLPPLPEWDRPNTVPHANNLAKQTTISQDKEELNDLANNDIIFESFFEELDRVKNMGALLDEMRTANEMLAKKTLAREPELIQLRQSVLDQQKELRELEEEFHEKLKAQKDALRRFSPTVLLSKLKSEVQLSDELSEQMANSFLEGGLENDLFLKHFREVRKVFHLRNAKVERVNSQPGILGP